MDQPYPAIGDHAAIGNLRTVALVDRWGSIGWCCLPRIDSPSVFASLLDHQRGGRFSVRRAESAQHPGEQRYLRHTNVVETTFSSDSDEARLVVTDFMPLAGSLDGTGGSTTRPAVYRLLRAEGGDVDVLVEWSPRLDHGRSRPRIMRTVHAFLAWAGADALTLSGLGDDGEIVDHADGAPMVRARFTMRAGEQRALVTHWGSELPDRSTHSAQQLLDETVECWCTWVHKAEATGSREWAAPYQDLVVRSELAIKLLTNADTGAIAAAATTSLPEDIGGVRNWDYRFAWIRDAALAAQALHALGHDADGHSFVEWAERAAREHGRRGEQRALQIVYGVGGETELDEAELPNFEGYQRSAPVRTGNGAVDQLQLDVFGELISAVYELVRVGDEVGADILEFLPALADDACSSWHERDYGVWELRNGPFHLVYSKVMVWMALDRAIALAEAGIIDGDTNRWSDTLDQIRDEVLERGFDPELGAFRQSYERSVLDASNLLLPLLEFLPFDDPRVQSTIDATIDGLTENELVHRYVADDGIAGSEGGFGLCTFWLVDALALSGRLDEARTIFESMAGRANHVGLYAEQIDPDTGAFLGNFPQAFTHLGLINSALYLAHAEGRESPVPDPIGSEEHRSVTLADRLQQN
jgi:GH15 family glucan-1,4-alpha-glucosidase